MPSLSNGNRCFQIRLWSSFIPETQVGWETSHRIYVKINDASGKELQCGKQGDVSYCETLGTLATLARRNKLPIKILTDHKNLMNFSNPQILNQRQMRWLRALQKYNFVIRYRPGKQNSAADALSRRQDLMPPNKDPPSTTLLPQEKFVELDLIAADDEITIYLDAIATDSEILEKIQEIEQNKLGNERNDIQYREGRVVVPENDDIHKALLALYHDAPMAGHPGITGTYELLGRMYTWPKMKDYVEAYVQGCPICTKSKKKNTREQGKLQPLPNPMTPWHWTSSDLIGPLPKSKGKNAIYVVIDRFTKYTYFILCNTTETAQSLAHLHAKHIWTQRDFLKYILSIEDLNFKQNIPDNYIKT